ncbi:hypothetical protein GC176_05035 [bacterium]|nr:hypothetical protein [bacterium]
MRESDAKRRRGKDPQRPAESNGTHPATTHLSARQISLRCSPAATCFSDRKPVAWGATAGLPSSVDSSACRALLGKPAVAPNRPVRNLCRHRLLKPFVGLRVHLWLRFLPDGSAALWNSAPLRLCVSLVLLLLPAHACFGDIFKPDERFLGMLTNGEYVHGDRLHDWHDAAAEPKLAGRAIFDGGNPFRWVIDQGVTFGPPPNALIEFYGGDCLPGRVVDYEAAEYDSFDAHDEYLVVEPAIVVDRPGEKRTPFLRISTRWLKRVVFERKLGVPSEWRPGTAFLHDGSAVRFRGVRWAKGAVAVLTDDGVKTLLHSQIAELHLPDRDGWENWFEQLAVLSPDLKSRLLQIECESGLRLTASTTRYRPEFAGDQSVSSDWYPVFHPAWSLDPLTIPFPSIRVWRFFAPTQVPATLLEPTAERDGVVFSSGWNWQRDRSVQQTTAISGQRHLGWGFGTHAPSQLRLPLHGAVTAFRTRVGLDQLVRTGGCARASLAFAANPSAAVWRSVTLIGSEKTFDSGWQNVPNSNAPDAALLLTSDPLINERPRGADPFDIRDCVDWIEPEFRLDATKLQQEVARRRTLTLPALHDWKLTQSLPPKSSEADTGNETSAENGLADDTGATGLRSGSVWSESVPNDERFGIVASINGPFAAFTRELRVKTNHRWLAISIDRPELKQPAPNELRPLDAIVRLGGRTVLQQPVPQRSGQNIADPILVPLTGLQNQKVRCEVILFSPAGADPTVKPTDEAMSLVNSFEWLGAELTERPPGIAVVFDEDREFVDELTDGEGILELATSDVSSGSAALKVSGGERSNPLIKGVELPLREYPRLGEFRYLRFAWKKPDGELVALSIAHDGLLGLPEMAFDGPRPQAFRPAAARREFEKQRSNPRRVIQSDDRGAKYAYQYDSGTLKTEQPVLRLDRRLPTDWVAHTRDLFAEFGAFTLTGIGIQSRGGGAAMFDQIYLARTQADFDWIPHLNGTSPTKSPDENVLAEPRRPRDLGQTVAKIAPQFALTQTNDSVLLLRESGGRANVLRTHPQAQDKPAVFRSPVSIRAGKKTELHISTTHHPDADWELLVRAAGQDLHRQAVSKDTVKDGWLDVSIDLSRFAGQNIVLEVVHQPTGWQNEFAYWSRLEITEQ